MEDLLGSEIGSLLRESKVLVVGAGGIGCELLKNLVLSGFKTITIIDLDTIDVSNLNRQFLFRKEHVSQSKALVAKESALEFNPNVDITAHHGSIIDSKYNVNFYKEFDLVLNALDNGGARSHVNRMCLAAKVPLIESGSAGYKGHVALHKKGLSECYDCTPRPHQKTFPGCTIRNTPSEPIHTIVWAKHLFNQLFGVADPDEDVSPDSADPDGGGPIGEPIARVSTRQWAKEVNYCPHKLFHKLFHDDIHYLLSMENLWAKRRAPTPLDRNELPHSSPTPGGRILLEQQKIWTLREAAERFDESVSQLKCELESGGNEALIWDKDHLPAITFVTAASNIRSFIFGITLKSPFDTKSMAGNIIPAIPSTNAIVGGLVVITALNVLRQQYHKCPTIYVSNRVSAKKREKVLFALDSIVAPNPKCFVCAEKPEICVKLDVTKMTLGMFGEKVLIGGLNMIAPDVEMDGEGTILISSEEGETDGIAHKTLAEFNVKDGTRLKCDDFLQNYQLLVQVVQMKEGDEVEEGKDFVIVGDSSLLGPVEEKIEGEPEAGPSKSKGGVSVVEDDDDDLILIEEDEGKAHSISTPKRPLSSPIPLIPTKKRRMEENNGNGEQQESSQQIQLVSLE